MAIDLKDFVGVPPYASELFGVYQPLLGWKGHHKKKRLSKERRDRAHSIVAAMLRDSRFSAAVSQAPKPYGPDAGFSPLLPVSVDTVVGRQVQAAADAFVKRHRRSPTDDEWTELVGGLDLSAPISVIAKERTAQDVRFAASGLALYSTANLSKKEIDALGAQPVPGTRLAVAASAAGASHDPVHEAVVGGTVQYLAKSAPALLSSLFLEENAPWKTILPWLDPLASFDDSTQKAVLSPIGLLQLFRQYFFELDPFLGPAVGHVWVSPGGSLELYEVHTRRSLEEQSTEASSETTSKLQSTVTTNDELSTAINDQNSRNTNMGASVSAGVNFGVFQSNASAQFGVQEAQTASEQTAHKETRQQSDQVASEIRRDFKTTFRTSVETTDTSSRRYVLSNNTDKLVNYELRRKMRQVAVQVQHIGTQLCWEVYLDDPGRTLGIAELVHVATSHDLEAAVQPPEAPEPLAAKTTSFQIQVPFQGLDDNDDNGGCIYNNGAQADSLGGLIGKPPRIKWQWQFSVPPPAPGYTLAPDGITEKQIQRVDPNSDPPYVSAQYATIPASKQSGENKIEIDLVSVSFQDQTLIGFDLDLQWNPPHPDPGQVDYEEKYKAYTAAKKRAAHADFVTAVRERVNVASGVLPRSSDDMRDEERAVIFRRLIGQLTKAAPNEGEHVTVELIRAIFDVDKMLYFVAEDWWMPRRHHTQQLTARHTQKGDVESGGLPKSITGYDLVGWGGVGAKDRDNYLITENSVPAPLGASLGWLIQLDADSRRNAFLNSPFVKAVIPIQPGKEAAAINWLKLAHVEGTDGLHDQYGGSEPALQGTVEHALLALAKQLNGRSTDMAATLQAETVFQNGFDPLAGGFRASGVPGAVFDQWIEVLPTEQIVAVDFDPSAQK